MRLHALATAAALTVGACSAADAPGPARGAAATAADCVLLFQRYDQVEATMSTPAGRSDRMPIPPDLQLPAMQIRNAGCITMTADLARMAEVAAPAVADGGRAIAPTRVHAGAVTSMADDAAARAFFEAHGVRATSVGSPALGRRIHIGPFATEGALDGAMALAKAAGFASPYPARF